MKRFMNIKEPWGDFVHAKVNCPELLTKELERNKPGNIFMSSVTDPYQLVEGKYKLTRSILEVMASSPHKKKFSLEILTKSALARRDFDLMKSLDCELGTSVNTLDSNATRLIEPFASPPKERIKMLKEANEHGIRVFGFISPVIPGITELEPLFKELSFASYTWVELLNTKTANIARLMPVLEKHCPDSAAAIKRVILEPEAYFGQVSHEVRRLEKAYGLKVMETVRHDKKR